ncbi:hypothetical protein BSP12_016 [Bacillus phage BSP12]|nr:hypothetical protein BSP12_016 [Bacillus phage BSP12]
MEKEIWEAKAKVGDYIKAVYQLDEHNPPGTVFRVHNISDMSAARANLEEERKELGDDLFDLCYPSGTISDVVHAFPTWVRMGVDIHKECFGIVFFLENEDYEVLTQEETADYLAKECDGISKKLKKQFKSTKEG